MEDMSAKATELESQTQHRVSESLSKIEVALSEWDAAAKKPKRLEKRIEYLRMSQSLLSGWERESLRGRRDFDSTLGRLRKFTEVCDALERARGKLHDRKA